METTQQPSHMSQEVKIRLGLAALAAIVGFFAGQEVEKRSYEKQMAGTIMNKVFSEVDDIKKEVSSKDD